MFGNYYFATAIRPDASSPSASYYNDTIANADLLAYWRLNDTGATAIDVEGGFNLTILAGWTKGQTGLISDGDTAMVGDGSNSIGSAASGLNPWSSAFTVECWAKENTATTGWQGVFSTGVYVTNGFRVGRKEDRWAVWTDESAGDVLVRSAAGAVSVGVARHLVVTRSGTTWKLYVNGVDVTTSGGDSAGSTYVAPAGGAVVGGHGGGYWKGTLDEVAVYSTAKSSSWALARYNLGISGAPPPASTYASDTLANGDLTAYWRLGDLNSAVADSSPNGHNLTRLAGWVIDQPGIIDDTDRAMTGDGTNSIGGIAGGVNPWSGAFTVECWAREEVGLTGYRGLFSAGTYLTNGFRIGRREDRWAVWTDESGGGATPVIVRSAAAGVVVGSARYIVVTRSGTTWKLYVNGVDVTTAGGDSTGTGYVAPSAGAIPGGFGGGYWQGTLDEIAVYSSAKSSAWVSARYTLGS